MHRILFQHVFLHALITGFPMMQKLFFLSLPLLLAACSTPSKQEKDPFEPLDYLWAQRAYPYGFVPSDAYYQALEQSKNMSANRNLGLNWTLAGPTRVSGRISDVAMHPADLQTVYAAAASGGVWKSTDAGHNWTPITDNLPSLSIGDIAIDPSDQNTLYVGTGEPNAGGGSVTYDGRGVFKSTDAGQTWTALGLENIGSVGRIEVDPKRPNRVFVAAMGSLFANNSNRGLYRSLDGGQTWDKSLFVNDSTGCVDLAIHPQNPDTLFAVSWQRIRRPNRRQYGGPGCGIWRSTDGGDTWSKLSAGLPANSLGRIGISICANEPDVMWAIYSDEPGNFKGVYKSVNAGTSWTQVNGGDPGFPGFGWWFGQIRVHPNNPDEVYTLGLDWVKTTDGGQFWADVSPYLHADYHALYIHPANPDFLVAGNDGGIYISENGGDTWEHRPFPITQFYTSEIDFQNPTHFYGGAQDNGTWRTITGTPDNWQQIGGGDGFVTLVNPLNNNIFYVASQYGGFSGTNGASAPSSSRYNWNTPYIFDPLNPDIMYIGAERIHKSVNGGLNWTPISTDLTNGNQGQNGIRYGTITTISASALNSNILWVGTDDGNVWVTSNGGDAWTKVSAALPKRWITRVIADLEDENTALVCLSGFRHFDDIAHIYRTTDRGQTWQDVSGNLPDIPVNDLVQDPSNPELIWYIATDAGVFGTTDGGATWSAENTGLPNVPVTDLTLHAPTRTLAAATYGRSMFRAELPPVSGISGPVQSASLRVWPNPVFDQANISWEQPQAAFVQIDLLDGAGRRVKQVFAGSISGGKEVLILDAKGLLPGLYLLRIQGEKMRVHTHKVVIM
ncbi:MAG TPA: glycosyl hydrolase [Saprospirales bacterium]|nr:glycosyl hydrolase [Saprospirales bacterium]